MSLFRVGNLVLRVESVSPGAYGSLGPKVSFHRGRVRNKI